MVSVIGDAYKDKWNVPPWTYPAIPEVSRTEFDALRREVESLRRLLEAAKKFDDETGQSGCDMSEKTDLVRKVAKAVGIDLSDLLQ